MKTLKWVLLVALLGASLLAPQAANAKLSIFSAEQAASRYAKQHCNASSCQVTNCRRLSRSRVDCSEEVWTVYPRNETCFYTLHISKYGKYSRPSVWNGGLEFCE